MRRFTTVCIDKETGAEMLLYDCSFNSACMFLEMENADNRFGEYKDIETISPNICKIIFEKAEFIYDELRGALMRRR